MCIGMLLLNDIRVFSAADSSPALRFLFLRVRLSACLFKYEIADTCATPTRYVLRDAFGINMHMIQMQIFIVVLRLSYFPR